MKTVYYNGKIYTGKESLQQAFLVENGIFTAVGSDEEVSLFAGADTARVNLEGRFACPGFNDSHMHLLSFGKYLCDAQLGQHTKSLSEMLEYLREYATVHPPRKGGWLRGRGWNQDYFTDTDRMPDRNDLDAISTEYPIMITRACGHCCAVNSRALEIAGITGDTASPEGGTIGMENGEPDGRLYDMAIDLLNPFLPLPDREELKEMILAACKAVNSFGITSVQSDDYSLFRGIPFETVNSVFRELEESGRLTVRVYEQANLFSIEELARFIGAGNVTGLGHGDASLSPKSQFCGWDTGRVPMSHSSLFRIGPLKMIGDGSLGSHTAYLSRPYADMPETRGLSLYTPSEMNQMISYANAHGMQIAVHAIGDACLDQVLDAFESALREHPRADHRHGIVHCQITRPEQLSRIRELGLHVYAQSVFLDYDNHIVESRAGAKLAASSYSWKTLMNSGVSVSNGSDCPVELPDVMRGIECAVTRTSLDGTGPYLPHEAFSVKEALDSFTIRGAEASFEESFKGRIAPGYIADFTILDRNPFEVPARELHTISVHCCYLGGNCVSHG